MKHLLLNEWIERKKRHEALVSPLADAFLERRALQKKHPVHDFLFTYYSFSPTKLKQWVPSFEESLQVEDTSYFNSYWFKEENNILKLNLNRLRQETLDLATSIKKLCQAILERAPRFGCFGLHEWAMIYELSQQQLRYTDQKLRLSQEECTRFIKSQNLCCTHYDAYRFFTHEAKPLNLFKPTLDTRVQHEQGGCLHANMDIYKWATKLWPWIGSDFIQKAFLIATEGRELDMRASPYDLKDFGYPPICIETENGRKEYQKLQQEYYKKSLVLREELADFCEKITSLS
jgi:hypothetical protein